MRALVMVLAVVGLVGCAARVVRQADLDAWRNVPVIALDTHSLFNTVPMTKRQLSEGLELRNYKNGTMSTSCSDDAIVVGNAKNPMILGGSKCMQEETACNNLFLIRDGVVLEYQPRGQCFTDERVRPEPGWQRFQRR